MGLGLLADAEGVDGGRVAEGGPSYGVGKRIGAHGQTANGVHLPARLADGLEPLVAHQYLTFSTHGGTPAIDVVGRLGTRGKYEGPQLDTALEQELLQPGHDRPKMVDRKPGFFSP